MSTPTIDAAVRPEGDIGEAADIVIEDAAIAGGAAPSGIAEAPTFAELGVDPRIVSALGSLGIERTFAIQALTLPIALVGHDLIGQVTTAPA